MYILYGYNEYWDNSMHDHNCNEQNELNKICDPHTNM